jgi:hypothetical protein
MKKSLQTVVGIVSVFVVAPIWYYLLYKILASINATELMWFLYWIYLPVALIMGIISKITESK